MNREIKFRAWDGQKMLSGFLPCGNNQALYFHSGTELEVINDVTLMQYMNFKDRNNIELYEGDFVLPVALGESEPYLIKWRLDTLSICATNKDGDILPMEDLAECEIIGNVFESIEIKKLFYNEKDAIR